MTNSIEFAKNYTGILDEVYQRAAVSRYLNNGGRMVRAGRNAKEILIPKISITGLGDYTRNVSYKTGSIKMHLSEAPFFEKQFGRNEEISEYKSKYIQNDELHFSRSVSPHLITRHPTPGRTMLKGIIVCLSN